MSLKPSDESQLSEAISAAKRPLRIIGNGTRGVMCDGDVLTTAAMNGITLYEPGALTIVAAAGTPLADIEATLASEGQRLPFEPMQHRALLGTEGEPTIGGVVAANISGSRRVQAGACRDSLIGVRFVDGRGDVLKNGGRVMKNVTGYDLVKLMAGAHGTLGVISEVAFKVLPDVEATAVLRINGLSDADAVLAMSRALGSPYEVSGAAHSPQGMADHAVTLIRLEGFEASVLYRAEQLRLLLADLGEGVIDLDPACAKADWKWVRDVAGFEGRAGNVWRISVKPSDAPQVVAGLGAEAVLFDWGGGLIWALVEQGVDVRAKMGAVRGHTTLVRGTDFARFQPEVGPLAVIGAGLRAQFDPRGILNAGLMS